MLFNILIGFVLILGDKFVINESIHWMVMRHGNIDILEWMFDDICTFDFELDDHTSQENIFEILKWVYSKKETIKIIYTSRLVNSVSNHKKGVEILSWLLESEWLFLYDEVAIDNACNNNLDVLNWWYDKYHEGEVEFKYSYHALNNAICSNLDIVKWWLSHADEFELKCTSGAFYVDDLCILNYLHCEQNIIKISIENDFIDLLCQEGTVKEVMDFWFNHRDTYGFTYSHNVLDYASIFGHCELLEWWLSNDLIDPKPFTTDSIDHASIAILDKVELKYTAITMDIYRSDSILNWWHDKRFDLEMKYTEISIINNIEWWMKHSSTIAITLTHTDRLKLRIDQMVDSPGRSFLQELINKN
jgi:hypothetical protein